MATTLQWYAWPPVWDGTTTDDGASFNVPTAWDPDVVRDSPPTLTTTTPSSRPDPLANVRRRAERRRRGWRV